MHAFLAVAKLLVGDGGRDSHDGFELYIVGHPRFLTVSIS